MLSWDKNSTGKKWNTTQANQTLSQIQVWILKIEVTLVIEIIRINLYVTCCCVNAGIGF